MVENHKQRPEPRRFLTANYVWLPLRFDGEMVYIEWKDEWRIQDYELDQGGLRLQKNRVNEFIWGAATASYQIEGAVYENKKGLSIWDVFSLEKGRIFEGHTGEVACDHYHRMKEDVKLMSELGIRAYRFSVSWARILPNGIGEINEKGIQFYSDLIDELLKYNITPYMTLFHWDYPYELHKKGGWLNPESSEWFAEYVGVIAQYFGNKVKCFFTFNEPQVFIGCGYQVGNHAPGLQYAMRERLLVSHNVMLAHGKAVLQLRKEIPGCKVGYAPTCGEAFYPSIEEEKHIDAARNAYDYMNPGSFLFSTEYWNEPILHGKYPEEWAEVFGKDMPVPTTEELMIINQPLDFLGMNIYQGRAVLSDEKGGFKEAIPEVGHPKTAIGWPITPECIYWATKFIYEKYHLPMVITENGLSCHDRVSIDGEVHDPNRIDYLHRHLRELKRAIDEGAEVEGYFVWSFMDNFEWSNGYNDRFGLVYVDYKTQKRIKKDSFEWYRNMIEANGRNGQYKDLENKELFAERSKTGI